MIEEAGALYLFDVAVVVVSGQRRVGSQFRIDEIALYHLLDHGAEVNAKDNDGKTALMLAAREGPLASVQALLAKGADISATNRWGETALTYAHQGRQSAIVRLLRKHGAKG